MNQPQGFSKEAFCFLFQHSTLMPQLKIATKWTDKHCCGCTTNGWFPLESNKPQPPAFLKYPSCTKRVASSRCTRRVASSRCCGGNTSHNEGGGRRSLRSLCSPDFDTYISLSYCNSVRGNSTLLMPL